MDSFYFYIWSHSRGPIDATKWPLLELWLMICEAVLPTPHETWKRNLDSSEFFALAGISLNKERYFYLIFWWVESSTPPNGNDSRHKGSGDQVWEQKMVSKNILFAWETKNFTIWKVFNFKNVHHWLKQIISSANKSGILFGECWNHTCGLTEKTCHFQYQRVKAA